MERSGERSDGEAAAVLLPPVAHPAGIPVEAALGTFVFDRMLLCGVVGERLLSQEVALAGGGAAADEFVAPAGERGAEVFALGPLLRKEEFLNPPWMGG